jgi:hypothetical protein
MPARSMTRAGSTGCWPGCTCVIRSICRWWRDALAADLPQLAGALFLRADVCRRELLVEVEATGVLR